MVRNVDEFIGSPSHILSMYFREEKLFVFCVRLLDMFIPRSLLFCVYYYEVKDPRPHSSCCLTLFLHSLWIGLMMFDKLLKKSVGNSNASNYSVFTTRTLCLIFYTWDIGPQVIISLLFQMFCMYL